MSEFTCPVISVGPITKHPNADLLSIVQVDGENVIILTGDFHEGDAAVYVPVDAVVPPTVPGTEFLGEHRRIRAKRLRGIYSEGLLLPVSVLPRWTSGPVADYGVDVAAQLGITKHQDKVPDQWGTGVSGMSIPGKRGLLGHFFHWCFKDRLRMTEPDPGCIPVYDIEPYRRHRDLLEPGERVIITEKLHGTNGRYAYLEFDETFYVGSRNLFWRDLDSRKVLLRERFGEFVQTRILRRPARGPRKPNLYQAVARQYDLESLLKDYGGFVFYGEIYGRVQDLTYDAQPGQVWFRVFDIYDTVLDDWLDWDTMKDICAKAGLDTVPVLYDGPFSEQKLNELVEGKSVLAAKQIREGVVVKPARSLWSWKLPAGRVILKQVSQAYKLRKNGTELQ